MKVILLLLLFLFGTVHAEDAQYLENRVAWDKATTKMAIGPRDMRTSVAVGVGAPDGVAAILHALRTPTDTLTTSFLLITAADASSTFRPLRLRQFIGEDSIDYWFPTDSLSLVLPSGFVPDRWLGPFVLPWRADSTRCIQRDLTGGAWLVSPFSME